MIVDYEGVVHVDSGLRDDRTLGNRPSRFTNFMHSAFEFTSDDFEVGLHEVQIPYTWRNLPADQYVAAFVVEHCQCPPMKMPNEPVYSVHELIQKINEIFLGGLHPPKLQLDPQTGKIYAVSGSFGIAEKGAHIVMSKQLAHMLGFTRRYMLVDVPVEKLDEADRLLYARDAKCSDRKITLCSDYDLSDVQYATSHSHIQMAVPRLYIGSSLVKHVSHSTRQLLRAIPVESNHRYGDILVKTYDRPIFAPISQSFFDRIDLNITDSAGRGLQFLSGNVIATLEFRRRQNAFF